VAAVTLAGALVLASCSDPEADRPSSPATSEQPAESPSGAPLRNGEKFVDLTMPKPYAPKAPTRPGTDDYRCFLLDPHLADPAFVTGIDVVPGRRDLVHHVILFRVGPDAVAEAKAQDQNAKGQGWTCFGGTGLGSGIENPLEQAPWLGAWAPGGGESVLAPDIGIPLEEGSRIVMQVHYNLLAGHGADTSSARLRLAPGTADLDPLRTMLMPAPVELACRPGKSGRLCDRDDAARDVATRFGPESGFAVAGLQLMCGGDPNHPKVSPVQSCDRTVRKRSTVRAVAGHMHRLGRSISVTLNPGTRRERVLLDIRNWDFDNQGAKSLKKPATIKPGDVLRVTCRHDQALRDVVPELKGTPERYVVWGEGTTDEMCLGIVMFTHGTKN
jgi:hypothetical protein